MENNKVILSGEVVSPFKFNHEVYGEGFYVCDLAVKRLSGYVDVLPLMVSDRLMDVTQDYIGTMVEVTGEFRSYNLHEGDKHRLVLNVFAQEIYSVDSPADSVGNNQISLTGYICKKPVFRETPRGRIITDILLAVNRPYGKSDYIPLVIWGRNAGYAAGLQVGDQINVQGRIQSRAYIKQLSDTQAEERTAYEVSVGKLEVIE